MRSRPRRDQSGSSGLSDAVSMANTVFYARGDISVHDHFARFGGKAYAINKINSVEVRSHAPPEKTGWIWFSIFAAIFGVAGVPQIANGNGAGGLIFAGLLGGCAFIAYQNRRITPSHKLFLMMSNSEAQVCESSDLGHIQALRGAIEQAIVRSDSVGGGARLDP